MSDKSDASLDLRARNISIMNAIRSHRTEKVLLLVWFMLNLFIGLLTVHEYGVSLDEPNNYRYATASINNYPSFFGTLYEPKYNSSYDGHGPAYVVIVAGVVGLVQAIDPSISDLDVWHFTYFVTFQLMCLCLYWLTKRWFSSWTAWGVLILFGTQPLLLGHSFMNPKDTPFMFLFTLSVVLGLKYADGWNEYEPPVSLKGFFDRLRDGFRTAEARRRRKFLLALVIAAALLLTWTVFSRQLEFLIGQVIGFFYSARPNTWAWQIFDRLAKHSSNVPLENYVAKASRLLERVMSAALTAGVIFLLTYFVLLVNHTTLGATIRATWNKRSTLRQWLMTAVASIRDSLKFSSVTIWFREFLHTLRSPQLILAGIALGLATAVRPIAPLAGLIIVLYLIAKKIPRVWTISLAYFLIAGIVTYIAWPYLWGSPILKYLASLGLVSNFPHFSGQVLFNGQFYGIRDLPYSYLPVLLSIQFTEPFIVAFYIGTIIFGYILLREQVRTDLIIYLGFGFAFPLCALVMLNSPLYHNFRQVLFLIPPMFTISAFALEFLSRRVPATWIRVTLILLIALPGIYSSIKLYPYQYVYYNSFVGGTAGVQDRFELDYWRTSLREAALRLNELAPQESRIIISGSAGLFNGYARPDLFVETVNSSTQDLNGGYDYSVQLSRWQKWNIYPDAEIVFSIERDGAVLATIRSVHAASYK